MEPALKKLSLQLITNREVNMIIVVLNGDTVVEVERADYGDYKIATLFDENGQRVTVKGYVTDILTFEGFIDE